MKYLIHILVLLSALAASAATLDLSEPIYQPLVPGVRVGEGKVLGGLYEEREYIPETAEEIEAKVQAKEAEEGRIRFGTGITIALIGLAISGLMKNELAERAGTAVMVGGGVWALSGIVRVWAATYWPWIAWACVIIVLFAATHMLRKKGLLLSWSKRP